MKVNYLYSVLFFILFSLPISLLSQNMNLYGISTYGGQNNKGYIFKKNINSGPKTILHSFAGVDGNLPLSGFILATNGKFYGMTLVGGLNSAGVIYEFDTLNNTCVVMHSFADSSGRSPKGGLMQAANGKLYGMTYKGGTHAIGVLFEYDISTSTYLVKYNFDSITGGYPEAALTEYMGKLYGVTSTGVSGGIEGSLFEYNIANSTMTVKKVFTVPQGNPILSKSDLLLASNGKLYGTSVTSGTNGNGILYEYDPVLNAYAVKVNFYSFTIGSDPEAYLMEGGNQKIYGMCRFGGAHNNGTIYSYDLISSQTTKIYDFDSTLYSPFGGFIKMSDGRLYGATMQMFGSSTPNACLFNYDFQTNSTVRMDSLQLVDMVWPPNTYHLFGHRGCSLDTSISVITDSLGSTTLMANQNAATYQWILCSNNNTPISNATNQMYKPLVLGTYAVVVTLGTCTDTSRCVRVVPTSIENNAHAKKISLIPNPSNGDFVINLGEEKQSVNLDIYNAAGSKIFDSSYQNMNKIRCHLPRIKGLYILKLTIGTEGVYYLKHIIF